MGTHAIHKDRQEEGIPLGGLLHALWKETLPETCDKKSAGAFGVREYISKSWLLLYTHLEEKNFKVYNILPIKNI